MQNALTEAEILCACVCVCVDVLRRINTLMHVLALTAAIICEYIIIGLGFRSCFLSYIRPFANLLGVSHMGVCHKGFLAFVLFFPGLVCANSLILN